ncbi:hypothetical protein ACN469_15465 [Corallococcus terminator]
MRKLRTGFTLSCILSVVSLGCSSSATGTTSRRDAYAQATCMDSETCCILRFGPEACGFSATEAAVLMAGAKEAASSDSDAVAWDDAHNENLPEWKRECIQFYGDCKEAMFSGPCYECLRRCEGQQEWPLDMCRPSKKKRK